MQNRSGTRIATGLLAIILLAFVWSLPAVAQHAGRGGGGGGRAGGFGHSGQGPGSGGFMARPGVGAGVFAFRIPFTGSYALLLLTMLLFILSVVGIGLMISSICATQQQAILGAFALGVPMILISGFATPVENMPTVLQWLSELVPLRHFLVIVQGTFLKALPARDVFSHLWPMAVIAAASLFVATIFVRSKLQ